MSLRRPSNFYPDYGLRGPRRLPVFFTLLAFICAFYSPCVCLAATPAALVQVRPHTTIDRETIQLGDLAAVACDDPGLQSALETVIIGKAPEPGLKRILSRNLLLTRLVAAHMDLPGLRLVGPAEITVTRGYQPLAAPAVTQVVREYIRRNTPWKSDSVQIKAVHFPQTLLPPGAVELRVRARPSFKIRERFYLTLEVYRSAQRVRAVLVEVHAEIWSDVAVADRALARGDRIAEEAIRLERRNLTLLPEDVILDAQELRGAVARVSIEPGRPLARHLLQQPQLVGRGDVVTLIAQGALYRLSTKAKARAPGKYGDVIDVVNLDSGKLLQAEVIGPCEVKAR